MSIYLYLYVYRNRERERHTETETQRQRVTQEEIIENNITKTPFFHTQNKHWSIFCHI